MYMSARLQTHTHTVDRVTHSLYDDCVYNARSNVVITAINGIHKTKMLCIVRYTLYLGLSRRRLTISSVNNGKHVPVYSKAVIMRD